MASEVTYAEVRFKNESNTSSASSEPSAAPKEKTSPQQSNPGFPKQLLASLLIFLLLLAISSFIAFIRKGWGCCPENWIASNTSCYFISFKLSNWTESEKNCAGVGAHLLVINTKEEQLLIYQKLDKRFAYYMGLSDPERTYQWQWVDQSPYDKSVTFWHPGEPSDNNEHCVFINSVKANWGWNNAPCHESQNSVCEMMKIYL
ncbi:C-type lectin domain family 4 member A-like isoform X3 [Loxodonta africana]|uniref:C-type lectin domain family 4 member A-like isoform X3 n=1 Tax=Loxodonta africana TaxID=9785 RepID=UPI00022345D2